MMMMMIIIIIVYLLAGSAAEVPFIQLHKNKTPFCHIALLAETCRRSTSNNIQVNQLMAQDRGTWWELVNVVMNLRVP
jgi:hypothetical protein